MATPPRQTDRQTRRLARGRALIYIRMLIACVLRQKNACHCFSPRRQYSRDSFLVAEQHHSGRCETTANELFAAYASRTVWQEETDWSGESTGINPGETCVDERRTSRSLHRSPSFLPGGWWSADRSRRYRARWQTVLHYMIAPPRRVSLGRQFTGKNLARPASAQAGGFFASKLSAGETFLGAIL